MKKKNLLALCFIILFCLILAIGIGYAKTVTITLQWDANTEEDLAGYKLHWGLVSRQYTEVLDVGNITQADITISTDGVWYIAATAYDKSGNQSDYSNEVEYKADFTPPESPGGCAIIKIVTKD